MIMTAVRMKNNIITAIAAEAAMAADTSRKTLKIRPLFSHTDIRTSPNSRPRSTTGSSGPTSAINRN